MRRSSIVLAAIVIATVACGRTRAISWPPTVTPLPSPATGDTFEPQLTMSDRGVILSWVERAGKTSRLKFAERTDDGWTTPIEVASGDDWFLSYADVPAVHRMPNGTLLATWQQQTDEFIEATNLRLTYSTDGGKTWSPSFLPHDDVQKVQHGFPTFVDAPGGGVNVLWLDGRNTAYDFDNPNKAAMQLRAATFDGGWKKTADLEVDPRVCECCPTTAVMTADGILAAYRDRSEKEVRDIAVSRFENGKWSAPVHVHADNWEIEACPVNGPMLAANGRNVVVAWFTAVSGQGQAFAAFSNDAGRTWGAPIRLDDAASIGRVGLTMLEDGSAIATWVEVEARRGQFRARRIEPSGAKSAPITIAAVAGTPSSGYPRVALRGNELLFAWTETMGDEGDPTYSVRTATSSLR
jgi:prepilin-type processing-associated H-X9-DG protein